MASLDKEGLYYVKEDPQLGKIRGWTPGRWRTAFI